MWLIGLGVEMIWNPPRQPQYNGVVERSQGIGQRWAEVTTCLDAEQLQIRIDEMDRIQREVYSIHERLGSPSRWEVFPQLRHSGREAAAALSGWNEERVHEHLAQYCLRRKVCSQGKISLHNRPVYIGTRFRGWNVLVEYDPLVRQWLIRDEQGNQLRTREVPRLERPNTQTTGAAKL